jgi:hypothetical protein
LSSSLLAAANIRTGLHIGGRPASAQVRLGNSGTNFLNRTSADLGWCNILRASRYPGTLVTLIFPGITKLPAVKPGQAKPDKIRRQQKNCEIQ